MTFQSLLHWIGAEESFPCFWAACITVSMNIYFGKGKKLRPELRNWKARIILSMYWFAIAWVIGHYRSFKFPKLW